MMKNVKMYKWMQVLVIPEVTDIQHKLCLFFFYRYFCEQI